jgi:hypothetical protein
MNLSKIAFVSSVLMAAPQTGSGGGKGGAQAPPQKPQTGASASVSTSTTTKVDDATPDPVTGKKKSKKGKGKKGIRAKFHDAAKATFVVQRQMLPDQTFFVRTIHSIEEGKDAKTGQVTFHKTEVEAVTRFDALKAEAIAKGWTPSADMPKAMKSEYEAMPEPAKVVVKA